MATSFRTRVVTLVAAAVGLQFALGRAPSAAAEAGQATRAFNEPIRPIPLTVELDQRKVRLGGQLFHDPQLSRDGRVSCASCHDLARGGVDHRPRSIGIDGAEGEVNAPTVLNSGFNFKQFWDGRADTLEAQVDGPLQHAKEMGSSWAVVISRLSGSAEYAQAFAAIYPDGVTAANVKDAIAVFERSLFTPHARFDQYLRGDDDVLTADEVEGYRLFKSRGCVSCHQGIGVGGNMFQVFGVMADYFAERGNVTTADLGRFNVTQDEADRHVFKVPSLRNVALTAPYFHDGSAPTLEAAVEVMGTYQLGRPLSAAEIARIALFLRTLTGEYGGTRP
ncbi:MAG: cytochrome-c peroxidase [Candidatus Binatia bacterium]